MDSPIVTSTSFIPKTRLTVPAYRRKGFGLGILASAFILFVSIAMFAGVYFYRNSLQKEISAQKESLTRAKKAFEPALISELSRLTSAINASKILLEQHQAVSKIFKLIGDFTLKETLFSNFQYSGEDRKSPTVRMAGETKGYSGVSQQARLYENSESVEQITFFGLGLREGGKVNFGVEIKINPSYLIYKP